jgi:hypothetical protein
MQARLPQPLLQHHSELNAAVHKCKIDMQGRPAGDTVAHLPHTWRSGTNKLAYSRASSGVGGCLARLTVMQARLPGSLFSAQW